MMSSCCREDKLISFKQTRAALRPHYLPVAVLRRTAATTSIRTVPVEEAHIDSNSCDDNSNIAATTIQQQQMIQTDLANIIRPYHEKQKPVVVRGAVRKIPATTLWSSWDYWQEIIDQQQQQVAIEMGGSYGSTESERVEIPFSAYLQFIQLFEERHGRTGSLQDDIDGSSIPIPIDERVYMAQNDLLPSLYKDVMIPDFCQDGNDIIDDSLSSVPSSSNTSTSTNTNTVGLGRLYSVMMWLGPRGCVSPLHFDPLDNCFMQHPYHVCLFEIRNRRESQGLRSKHFVSGGLTISYVLLAI